MISSLLPLKLKIIAGYVILVMIFIVLLILIYKENRHLSTIDRRSEIALTQRKQVEASTVQLLDITLFSEQIIAWKEEDISTYQLKLNKTTALLQGLQRQLPKGSQRNRITTILTLLSTKETQTITIAEDLKKLRATHELLNERMPGIIRQTKQDKQNLAEQIGNNYEKNEKKKEGFLGLFRSKKKARLLTEQENEVILRKNQLQSGILLRSLAKEIQYTHEQKSEQLLAHIDIENQQNAYLNHEISRLITEFNAAAQVDLKEKEETYLLGHEKALRLVSYLGIGVTLLAIVLYLILRHDLKNRYRYRMQLEKLNELNEELLRSRKNMMLTVSHDLRIPLTAIHGCTELLLDERHKEKRTQLCTTILQSSDSMTALLNALLNFQRLDAGKEQPDLKPFRLRNLADTLEAEFRSLACKVGLLFNVEYSGEDIVVTGDRERLHQIVGNLLSNAIKFTKSGSVELKLLYREEMLTIAVSDTGTGITKEQIKRIFQPFERLENAETQEGFGLGLSITQGLVGLLNGKIETQSEPGKGSTFTIIVPLSVTDEQDLMQTSTLSNTLPIGLKILTIDDDAVLLRMTRDMLVRYHIHCDTCQNVQELTMRMREQTYDLLITDIRMPQLSGFELLELLRTSDIGTSRILPVLALTARADCTETDFTTVGFAGCLYKPFSIAELLSAVQRCIGTQQEQPIFQVDFSELLSAEQNGKEMLELLIQETKKDMTSLTKSVKDGDHETATLLVHHLLPLWEIVRTDTPLRDLCQVLAQDTNFKDKEFRSIVDKVIITGKLLTKQAAEKIKEEGYE